MKPFRSIGILAGLFGLAFICGSVDTIGSGQETTNVNPEPSESVRRFLKFVAVAKAREVESLQAAIAHTDNRIKALSDEWADKRRWRVSEFGVKRTFFSLEDKQKALTEIEIEIASLKRLKEEPVNILGDLQSHPLPPIPAFGEFNIGDFGTLNEMVCQVIQITNPKQMLVSVGRPSFAPAPVNRAIEVGSVEDAQVQRQFQFGAPIQGQAQFAEPPQLVFVNGLETNGLVDGKKITPRDVFEVTGTKRLLDGRTVYVLEPIDMAQALLFAPKPERPAEQAAPSKKSKTSSIKKGKAKLGD